MNRTIKQLMEEDEVRRKAQWSEDMTYVFYYIFLVVCGVIAVFLGVTKDVGDWNIGLILLYIYGFFYMVAMEMHVASFAKVDESGKQVNIFLKYCYVPISLGHLFWAKLILSVKKIGLTSMVIQIIAILARAISNRGFSYLGVLYMPALLGVAYIIICTIRLYVNYRRAVNESKK